jgi:hypothetical protein
MAKSRAGGSGDGDVVDFILYRALDVVVDTMVASQIVSMWMSMTGCLKTLS